MSKNEILSEFGELVLNIGLHVGNETSLVAVARQALKTERQFSELSEWVLIESGEVKVGEYNEPTYVCVAATKNPEQAIKQLCKELQQDCIAVFNTELNEGVCVHNDNYTGKPYVFDSKLFIFFTE